MCIYFCVVSTFSLKCHSVLIYFTSKVLYCVTNMQNTFSGKLKGTFIFLMGTTDEIVIQVQKVISPCMNLSYGALPSLSLPTKVCRW